MPRYEFTEQAERDLKSILDYTLEQWGRAQADKYLDGIEALVDNLAANPDLGAKRDNLLEGVLSFPYVSHVLYYIKQAHGITILRVLHQRMDPKRHITTETGNAVDGEKH